MKLSIIVTVYNDEKHIARCLESILFQSYKDYELIIIDDGSDDNSPNIIKDILAKYPETDYKLFSDVNVGANLAKQKGIKKSSGEYIGFVDSDDYIERDFYKTLMNETGDEVDVVACEYILEGQGEIQRHADKRLLEKKYLNNHEAKLALLNYQAIYPYLCNKVIRKSLFKNLHYESKRFIGEDFMIMMQILDKADKVVLSDYNGYHYVMNENSQTKAGYSLLHRNMYDVFSDFYNNNQINDIEYVSSLERYILLHYMSILVNIARANKKEPELEKEIRSFVLKHHKDYILNSNDGFKAKVAVLLACYSYPLFKVIASRM